MRALDRLVRAIDGVSTAAGWRAGRFIVPITFADTYEMGRTVLYGT